MVKLSVVVVVYNMQREAPRTLHSLSPQYQQGIDAADYEVIVVDNGSPEALAGEVISGLGPCFRLLRIDDARRSPAAALNLGVKQAAGRYVGLMIDGARLLTPGLLGEALHCLESHRRPVVATLGYHLGPELQPISMQHGYDQAAEDRLLAAIAWPAHGYRLLEICAPAGSSRYGAFHPMAESNLLFVSRQLYQVLGGADERFDLPGGGMVNLDLYARACALPNTTLVVLLGEATVHQVHGGAHTGLTIAAADEASLQYNEQYQRLRGAAFQSPQRTPVYYGRVRPEVLPWLQRSCELVRARYGEPPLVMAAMAAAAQPQAAAPVVADCLQLDPPQRPELTTALPFSLLTLLGLRAEHRVLELGRPAASSLLLPFLQPQRYCCLDPLPQQPERTGVEAEVPSALAVDQHRRENELDLEVFGHGFDFILSQSVLCHAGHVQVGLCLRSARRALQPGGLLVAAFVESEQDQAANDWVYPALNRYSWKTISRIAAACGLHCRRITWPHPHKTWFIASPDLHRLEAATQTGPITCPDLTPA